MIVKLKMQIHTNNKIIVSNNFILKFSILQKYERIKKLEIAAKTCIFTEQEQKKVYSGWFHSQIYAEP